MVEESVVAHEGRRNIWRSIDKTYDPDIMCAAGIEAKVRWPVEISAIRSCLIPAPFVQP